MRVKSIDVIVVPFHAGQRGERVANGPLRLLEGGLAQELERRGHAVSVTDIGQVDGIEGEIGRTFEIKRRVATRVSAAIAGDRFPLVLAGNCNTSVGVHAGLSARVHGIVWFDAHADFNTPDEIASGYFDSMAVATLAGQCWHRLAASIPGYRPADLARFVYCGIRDFEPGQREKVDAHAIRAVFGGTDRYGTFADALAAHLAALPGEVMIHLDLDCLDTSVGMANAYAAPGGLSTTDLDTCLQRIVRCKMPLALTIASFDPGMPGGDRIAAAGIAAAIRVLGAGDR